MSVIKTKEIWASVKYQCRELLARKKIFSSRLHFWQWETNDFIVKEGSLIAIHYLGRSEKLSILKTLLGCSGAESLESGNLELARKVSVYEFPMPNALCIPHGLSTVIKLDKTVEEILASYSRSLRRSIVKQSPKFHYEAVVDDSTIDIADQTMLRPFAVARNGSEAHHLDRELIKDLALNHYGRLDFLCEGDEKVGCHLGNTYVRRGKRYWHVNRLGYLEKVFSERIRLQEVNSINLHLALEAAVKNGYDFCDYGYSLATPGRGLIEWKRRRKGYLTKTDGHCFYLKPPKIGADQFFWDSPLFALEGRKVTLHLGVPQSKTGEEVVERYKEMGYDGLHKVYLTCAKQPTEDILRMLEGLYVNLRFQPQIVLALVN